jgi:HAD superfamily hydrolase (TIGR01549 family)
VSDTPARSAPDIVVLDVGEVLIDETRVWSVWADLLGVSPGTLLAVLGAAIAQGGDHHDALPHVAPNVDWTALDDEHEVRYGGFRRDDVYADVVPTLTELRARGWRVVLAGNQPARRAAQLRALELPVDDLVTSDELGSEKPDPAFFAAVLERLGVSDPARVLYVGDRVDNDVLPAMEAGLATCWLTRGPWGQLQDLPDDVLPDLVLEGLAELPELLAAWHAEVTEAAAEAEASGEATDVREGEG